MNRKGFTLLEIVIVLVLVGAIIAIAAPRLLDKRSQNRKVFRSFVIAGKDLKSRAKLNGITYRLAFSLGEKDQSWWVERSSKAVTLDKTKIEAQMAEAEKPVDPKNPPPPGDFQVDKSFFKDPQTLPDGYRFKQIESGTADIVYAKGMGYIHFFPQGIIETSAIQIEDPKKNVFTLVYNPLTGMVDIIPEAKMLKDLSR